MIGVDITYRLPDLFAQVFGINYYIDAEAQPEKAERMSSSGTPVLTTITFAGKEYNTLDANGQIIRKRYNDFELPVATLVSITRAKRIIKTPVNAGSGTVKEMYGFDDWQIEMKGFCIPDSSQPQGLTTAEKLKEELLRWEKIADAIRIKGGLPFYKDIHDIVIEEFRTYQMKGSPKLIPFSIRATSDEPVELLLL